jgi:hypothetical protein
MNNIEELITQLQKQCNSLSKDSLLEVLQSILLELKQDIYNEKALLKDAREHDLTIKALGYEEALKKSYSMVYGIDQFVKWETEDNEQDY